MYTFQNIFLSLKGRTVGVKWLNAATEKWPKWAVQSEPTVEELLQQARTKLETAKQKSDSLVARNDVIGWLFFGESVKDILKKVIALNNTNKDKVTSLINEARSQEEWKTPDMKKVLDELQLSFDTDFISADAKKNNAKEAATKTLATPAKVEALRWSVGLTAQSEALKKLLNIDPNNEKLNGIITGLKDVNITSLLVLTRRNSIGAIKAFLDALGDNYASNGVSNDKFRELSYSADGALGGKERIAVAKFLTEYTTNPGFKSSIDAVVPYSESGLDATVALRDAESAKTLSVSKLVEFLSDVPRDRYRFQYKGETEVRDGLAETLKELAKNPTKFANSIANILGIWAQSPETLVAALKANPSLKAKLFDAINANAANGVVWLASFLKGNGAEKAESLVKEITAKAEKAISDAQKIVGDKTKPESERQKAQEILDALQQKWGTSWLTGEIQKVAQWAFFNLGKDAYAAGAGVSFETFVRGLTVTLGAGLGWGKLIPAAVLHYDIASGKLGETNGSIVTGNVWVGTSVFPVVIPFIDGGIAKTDKITTLGNGRGGVDTVGMNAQWSKIWGVASLSYMNDRPSEIEQSRAKLLEAVSQMSALAGNTVTSEQITSILTKLWLKSTIAYTEYWAAQVKELYRVNSVKPETSKAVKSLLLMGLVNSEVEKSEVEEAQNDRDAKSFKGGSIGVGHIFGVTFPVVGLAWKEGKMSYPVQVIDKPAVPTVVPTVAPAETNKILKFEELYTVSVDKKSLTFKTWEAPKTVTVDKALWSYDARLWVLTLTGTLDDVVMTPQASADNNVLDTVIVRLRVQAQKPVEAVRANNTSIAEYAGVIYTLNRSPEYKSFNVAILQIANQDYAAALATLQAFAPKDKRIAQILLKLDAVNHPENLQALNTYTYGARDVKNKNQVNPKEYSSARTDTIPAEKKLAWARWNEDNEDVFAASESHTPTPLSSLVGWRELSVSVFATPKGAAHRIDKYNGSITISSTIRDGVTMTLAQKDGLIEDHKQEITRQFENLKKFAPSDASVTRETYVDMLKTGKVPEALTKLGLVLSVPPVFFEARAMAAGNVCMNKTEGIGYPRFALKNTGGTLTLQRTIPPVQVDAPPVLEVTGGHVTYEEMVTTLTGTAVAGTKKPDVERTDIKTEIQTRDVQVSPTNIQIINGSQVIVVNTGGVTTNIPLTSLTRDQAIALSRWQSITIRAQVNVPVPVVTTTPGVTTPHHKEAVTLGMMVIEQAQWMRILQKLLSDSSFQFDPEKKK